MKGHEVVIRFFSNDAKFSNYFRGTQSKRHRQKSSKGYLGLKNVFSSRRENFNTMCRAI